VTAVRDHLAPALRGVDATDQRRVDARLPEVDGTPDKSRLGANAILAVSLAAFRASAAARGVALHQALEANGTLPVPMLNILNGGRHAQGGLDFQELMIVPAGAPTFADAIRVAVEVYWTLADLLRDQRLPAGVGDEGGFPPPLPSVEAGLHLIVRAIERAGYRPGHDIALDPAASEFHDGGVYTLKRSGDPRLGTAEMVEWCRRLVDGYPIVSIEDGLGESDWTGWKALTEALGARVLLVGDDIFVTNPAIIERAIAEGVGNAALIKPNQIGTLTETVDAVRAARKSGYRIVLSHRSGETEDSTIADLAVALGADFIKTGAPCRGERTAKYNQLLRIEAALGSAARYAGHSALRSGRA
jgi:enolase